MGPHGQACRRRRPSRAWLPVLAALVPARSATEVGEPQQTQDVQRFSELLAWLEAGIQEAGLAGQHERLEETFELTFGPYGRALASKRDVAAGELLALVPLSQAIYDRDYARQEGLQGFKPWQEVAVFMARERAAGESSRWAPYLRMIPESYPQLPKHWEPSLIAEHLEGSGFAEYLEENTQEQRRDWEEVRAAAGNISWEAYEWGHDTTVTRAAFWNGTEREGSVTPRRTGTSVLWPLHDLMPHGLPANVDYTFDSELQALRIKALTPVRKGEAFRIAYFNERQRLHNDVLVKWGFATEDALRVASVVVPPRNGVDEQQLPFSLEPTFADGAAAAFLGVLRARAAAGGPLRLRRELPAEVLAFPDAATGWVYWWNQSSDTTSWVLPGDPDQPYPTPATTWRIEGAALGEAEQLLAAALSRYPQSLAEDEALLAAGLEDARVRHMVALRRDEKLVLSWWLSAVRRALEMQGAPEEEVDAASVYEELPLGATRDGAARQPSDEL